MIAVNLTSIPDSVNIPVVIVGGAAIGLLVLLAIRNRNPTVLAEEGADGLASLVLPIKKLKLYQNKVTRTFASFFDSLLPLEYKIKPLNLYWLKLRLEHEFSGIGTKYFKFQTTLTDKWFSVCNKLSALLLVNTVSNKLFYGNSEICKHSTDPGNCEDIHVIPMVTETVCEWNKVSMSCHLKNTAGQSASVVNVIVLVCFVLCCQSLIDRVLSSLYYHAKLRIRDGICACCYEGATVDLPAEDDFGSIEREDEHKEQQQQVQHYSSSGSSIEYYDIEAMEEIGDELKAVQSRRTTLVRGVCYCLMKRQLDFVSPQQEVQWMLSNKTFKWTWILLPPKTIKHSEQRGGCNAFHALLYRCRNVYYGWYYFGDPQTCSRIVDHGHIFNHQLLVEVLVTNRRRANEIRSDVVKRSTEQEQDTVLMQNFLMHSLIGIKRKVVEFLLFHTEQRVARRMDRLGLQYLGLLCLPLYYLFSLLVVFFYGMSITPSSTPLWVMASVIAIFEEFVLLQPFRIWLMHVWIPSIARVEYLALHSILSVRAQTILMRNRGMVKNINSVIQHYHPACRAARLVPGLSASRILMSLTDYDLPVDQLIQRVRPRFVRGKVSPVDTRSPLYYDFCSTLKNNSLIVYDILFDIVSTGIYWLVCLMVYCLLSLPHWIQITIVEWMSVAVLNILAIAIYLTLRISFILTIVVTAVVVIGVIIVSYRHYYYVSNTDVNRYGIVERVGYKKKKPKAKAVAVKPVM